MIELLEPPLRYFSLYLASVAGIEAFHLSVWALPFGAMLAVVVWRARKNASQPSWGNLAAICICLAIAAVLMH